GNSMSASLNAASEVPANSSSGSGQATVKLDGDTLSWSISYSGLSGPVTGAHFHGPAAAGANAAVVLPFAGSLASPITGSKQLTAAQIAQLKSGLWYINLHTAANPGGEIRGQVR
ncbi:MAG: CHRD domain-containing protein, partial [Caldimonas sp.]